MGDGSAMFEKKHLKSKNVQKIQVTVIALDYFVQLNKKNVSFIKIDAQGHENRVLERATETLKPFKPFVQVKVGNMKSQSTKKILNTRKRIGYD